MCGAISDKAVALWADTFPQAGVCLRGSMRHGSGSDGSELCHTVQWSEDRAVHCITVPGAGEPTRGPRSGYHANGSRTPGGPTGATRSQYGTR